MQGYMAETVPVDQPGTEGNRCRLVLKGHKRSIKALALSPDGTQLYSGGSDAQIRVWKPAEVRYDRVL